MKQFEKWWHNPTNKKINKLCKEDAPRQDWTEAGYRRALERVLEEREAQGDNHLKCVFDWIEQELENETG